MFENTNWGSVNWDEVGNNLSSMASDTAGLAKQAQSFVNKAISYSNVFVSLAGSAGIAGFEFDIAEDESVELSSMITDHYVETGSPVQDHIALRPERVTVRGLVGEIKDITSGEKGFLQKATEKLVTLGSYLPVVSQAAGSIYDNLKSINKANVTDNLMNLGTDLFEAYRNINIPQNEQQKAFIYFEALRNSGALFTVQTPFRYYTDMAVEHIRCTQRANTRDLSSFEVTLKKIRYVNTEVVELKQKPSESVDKSQTQGKLNQQKQSYDDIGQVVKTPKKLFAVKDAVAKGFNTILDAKFIGNAIDKFVNIAKNNTINGGGSW